MQQTFQLSCSMSLVCDSLKKFLLTNEMLQSENFIKIKLTK